MKRFLIVTALFVLVACDSTSEETPTPSLTVSPMVLMLTVGESQQLDVMVEATATSADVMFSSDAPDVARVDENGVVEAVSLGTATITVSIDDLMETVAVNVTEDITGATCQGDFTVTNQTELEALSDCEVIRGTLTIDNRNFSESAGATDITDLRALSKLTRVTNLNITTNLALTSLTGLENVTTVTGNLTIGYPSEITIGSSPEPTPLEGNNLLTTLSGFDNLQRVGGDLSISFNDNLASLEGVGNLETIAGNVTIFWNVGLETLEGLHTLKTVGGNINVGRNPLLESVTGLDSLEQVGDESVSILPSPLTLQTLERKPLNIIFDDEAVLPETVNATFHSNDTDVALASNSGVVEAVGEGTAVIVVSVEKDSRMLVTTFTVTVEGEASEVTCVGNFTVTNQAGLEALSGCGVVEGTLKIDDNAGLSFNNTNDTNTNDIEDLTVLAELTQITNLHIANNLALTSLRGLENLTVVTGDLTIGGSLRQPQLSPAPLPLPRPLPSQGNLLITSLAGLDNLRTVGGDLNVFHNTELRSFTGLGNLEEVAGDFNVATNYQLMSFVGLNALQRVGGTLDIFQNSSLETLDGLQNLEEIGGNIAINSFNNLSSPDALDALASLTPEDIGGVVDIADEVTCVIALCDVNTYATGF
jgi:uncharacterized protein YjdB